MAIHGCTGIPCTICGFGSEQRTGPRTTDYCTLCGDSPDSARHTLGSCVYGDPRATYKITYAETKNCNDLLAAYRTLYDTLWESGHGEEVVVGRCKVCAAMARIKELIA